tara:strand:- start:312 stop:506 length:195 start_codon:yes stop_codon:yes gene_type:complete
MEILEIEKKRKDNKWVSGITLEEQSGIFIIREWVDGSCENAIFLSQDNIEEICNKVLEHKKGVA